MIDLQIINLFWSLFTFANIKDVVLIASGLSTIFWAWRLNVAAESFSRPCIIVEVNGPHYSCKSDPGSVTFSFKNIKEFPVEIISNKLEALYFVDFQLSTKKPSLTSIFGGGNSLVGVPTSIPLENPKDSSFNLYAYAKIEYRNSLKKSKKIYITEFCAKYDDNLKSWFPYSKHNYLK